MKQKHCEVIKAWADGAEIQYRDPGDDAWINCGFKPAWFENSEYRVKQEQKPDLILLRSVRALINEGVDIVSWNSGDDGSFNLKLTFDGETGKLKSAEVMK